MDQSSTLQASRSTILLNRLKTMCSYPVPHNLGPVGFKLR